MSETVKVTVNLPASVMSELREIAASKQITMTDAIRQSIQINKYLLDQEQKNGKLLIEKDGKFIQIVRK
jgi:hypothetical protein